MLLCFNLCGYLRTTSIAFILIFFNQPLSAQNEDKYSELVDSANRHYELGYFKKAASTYMLAFEQFEGKAYPSDRYKAACAYAQFGELESSFFHLFRLAESSTKYKDYDAIIDDTALNELHHKQRWGKLLAIIKANKEESESNWNLEVVKQLDSIYFEDQHYRKQIPQIQDRFGRDSKELKAHWMMINHKDSTNLIAVSKILEEHGWQGADVFGVTGNRALFMVIQHSDLETQVKYMPMMKEAVKKENANRSSLALLEDRVALKQGKKQIYGSQIGYDKLTNEHYVLPISNPDQVEKRREEAQLPPLSIYTKNWDFEWDLERHKKRVKRLEASEHSGN